VRSFQSRWISSSEGNGAAGLSVSDMTLSLSKDAVHAIPFFPNEKTK